MPSLSSGPLSGLQAVHMQGNVPSAEVVLQVRGALLDSHDLRHPANLERSLRSSQCGLTEDASKGLTSMLQVLGMCPAGTSSLSCTQ